MHFISIEWFAWMAFTISTFWLLPSKWRHHSLIAITLAFLAVYSPQSLFILVSLSAISFGIVNHGTKQLSGLYASFAIFLNVTILVFYKINAANQSDTLLTTQIIPLGLAYYTLRLIHYIIEGYKGKLQAHKFIQFIDLHLEDFKEIKFQEKSIKLRGQKLVYVTGSIDTKKIKNLDITWKLSSKENKILDVEIEKISLIKTQKLEMRPLLKKNKNNFSQFIKIYFSN